jgi:hydroxymethylpyrimidine pyrophosphatase-like HAD family hydrolase
LKPRIFLSDNDGTLTVSRKPCAPEIERTLIDFADKFPLVLVTGSPYEDMLDQHTAEFLNHPNVEFAVDMGNTIYKKGKVVYTTGKVFDTSVVMPHIEHILQSCPIRYPGKTYPEKYKVSTRFNFTILGRPNNTDNPTSDECHAYGEWDKINGQRAWVIEYLRGALKDYNITLGGSISIDITKDGDGKEQAVGYYAAKGYDVSYIGDRIGPDGNDHTSALETVRHGGSVYAVGNPGYTARLLRGIIRDEG